MVQILNLADRKILAQFHGLSLVGIYDKGYGLGAGVKFALSAFEPAWQPFVFSRIGQPDARETLARVATYAWTVFVTVGLGVAVFGQELLMALTFTNPSFWPGGAVVPVVVLAYLLHGAFLLTSIGVGIEKRTRYYPVITAAAAATNLAANYALIPSMGMMGAAWATVLGYAVMAVTGFVFSHRVHPIPFEWARAARVSVAALGVFALSRVALGGLAITLAWKTALVVAYPLVLWLVGFWTPSELARIKTLLKNSPLPRSGRGTG
jgi:O-antigen/teichoic acid export membrane protein